MIIALVFLVYFAVCYPLYVIAKNTGVPDVWRAWVPIVNLFLLLDIAGLSYAYALIVFLGFLLMFVPPLKGVVSLCCLIFSVYLWARVAGRVGVAEWTGILIAVPFVNFVYVIYLTTVSKHAPARSRTSDVAHSSTLQNWHHPELQEGETLLGNYTQTDFDSKVRWNTKRIGGVAYDTHGVVVAQAELHPVFVQKSELQKAGLATG